LKLFERLKLFIKACDLPNAPDAYDVDEFSDDQGFEDDELLVDQIGGQI